MDEIVGKCNLRAMSGRTILTLAPEVLAWARARVGATPDELATKLKINPEDVVAWERDGRISSSRVRKLAKATRAPWASLYRASPPVESLPLEDFRTLGAGTPSTYSVDLRETVDLMRGRVDWMRDRLLESGADPVPFVSSGSIGDPPDVLADALRQGLALTAEWAARHHSYEGALSALRDHAEQAGVLVVFNGVVGNDIHRPLDRREFQGFAIADPYAPLVFVNNADFKSAQMFTFAHEMAHLLLGADALSRYDLGTVPTHQVERCCNRVAAEFLVPGAILRRLWCRDADAHDEVRRIARRFKVSTVVLARRALDAGLIDEPGFRQIYVQESALWSNDRGLASGGNFWVNQKWRIGPRFAAAITSAVRAGQLTYPRAFRLTGLSGESFFKLNEKLN